MTALVVDGLAFAYAGPPLFDDWSHAFEPGVTWLRGDNGCGKSTLLRLLAGALEPRSGHVRYGAFDAVGTPVDYRRHVHWSGPDGPAFDHLKPIEYFGFVAGLYPAFDVALAQTMTAELGLEPFLPRRIRELSTGSRRKVATIAAIASNTDVVLLDEPLAALDLASSRVVKRRLADAAMATDRVWIVASHEPLDDLVGARVLELAARAWRAAPRAGGVDPGARLAAPSTTAPPPAAAVSPTRLHTRARAMERTAFFDNLQARIAKMLEETPAADLRNNLRALLQQGFEKFDLATREQLDLQTELLSRAQERIGQLEARIARLEGAAAPASSGSSPLVDPPLG